MNVDNSLPPDWQVHFSAHFRPYPRVRHAVFDFDGTLSLVRGGWADIMVEQFLEHLPMDPARDSQALRHSLLHDILALNGKPTVHQMELLAEMVVRQGGLPETPDNYNLDFQRRLRVRVVERLRDIQTSPLRREQHLVHDARIMLGLLRERGITIHLLSGTAKADLLIESDALGLSEFLHDRIHGPENLKPGFTKRAILEQIVRENQLQPGELMCFGDGAVEIIETIALGGLAIGVASDEAAKGSGRLDPNKQVHLEKAGAHVTIPDYRYAEQLLLLTLGT